MNLKSSRIFIFYLFFFFAFFQKNSFSDYVAGIDTTDVNGYGLDSAIKINNSGNCQIYGDVVQYLFFDRALYL